MKITATMLYDYVQCPHKVTMDQFGDPALKDPISSFVRLLWDKGVEFEKEVIESLKIPFENLRPLSGDERAAITSELMKEKVGLIYGGRIRADDLLGDPDLLRFQGGGYVAGDIKSGASLEGASETVFGRPKKHYAVQLGLYTEILERQNLSAGRNPFIWDVHGDEAVYEMDAPLRRGTKQRLWDLYEYTLESVRFITKSPGETLPALSAQCKLCQWRSACTGKLKDIDDLSLIPELGRSRRDILSSQIKGVSELAHSALSDFIQGERTVFPRISPQMLETYQQRAKLLSGKNTKPYLKQAVEFPDSETELFFDIETDPFRDLCYLHGFVERRKGDPNTEKYVAFLMESPTPEEEEEAFRNAWTYIESSRPCSIYYYSPYEKTTWRKLQQKYPRVMPADQLEALFLDSRTMDLYLNIVKPHTEWPTNDHSIKTLAKYCGFKWRDTDPSGAASIEWYHRWVESGDSQIKKRILEYNEDDCVAMRVVLDKIKKLNALRK